MKLGNLTAERQRKRGVAPPKRAWAAIAISAVLHAVGFAALVTWPTNSHVRFAGRERAFQFMLSFTQPQWDSDPVTLDDFETDLPVVIEPNKARIGKRAYVHSPTVEISVDDLLLDSAIDSTLSSNSASSSGSTEEIPPDFSQNTPPTYPSPAIQNGWEGTVLLRVWIDETGRVTKVEVARTSGYRILDGAAATAVRQWIAIPANRGAKPVATVELLPVQFQLPLEDNEGFLP